MAALDDIWLNWPAPAKLNLFLHITGRRADGYHELQTAFQFLDFGDVLSFVPRADGRVCRVGGLDSVPESDDLVVRAACLLQRYAGVEAGVDIHLDKRLPVGGGLGGGSSDAATVLCALNYLWQLRLDVQVLAELGLSLGADVPVFVRGRAAWAEGVGEKLTPVEPLEHYYLVLSPPCHVVTEEVFTANELTRDCRTAKIGDFLSDEYGNVCEAVVFERYPQVREAHDWLLARVGNARMTGTGACVFAWFPNEEAAQDTFLALPDGWQGFVARGLNRSPLLERFEGLK